MRSITVKSVMLLSLGLASASASVAQNTSPSSIVQTQSGSVRGVVEDDVVTFRGIPYAAPPVGQLRWAPPRQPASWKGTMDATHYGSGCPQLARYGLTEAGYNEDCLFINVTVPGDHKGVRAKRPVMVWIYGGAFVGGSSALYPLTELAKAGDAVIVSFNYRLGVFGFMAHPAFNPDANGAYGLEDQRQALRWVQANIAAFGGDPRNVTVAGESAGAASICMHIIAPKESTGLFQKAIIQSAGCVQHLRTVQEASVIGDRVANVAGCTGTSDTLACMQSKSPRELLEAASKVAGSDIMTYVPSVGTPAVPQQGLVALSRNEFVHVPILNGGNSKELLLYVAYAVQAGQPVTPQNYLAHLEGVYGDKATVVAAEYPVASFPSAPEALGITMSDFTPVNGLNNCLFLETGKLASKSVPVYEYQFADPDAPPVTENPGFPMGAVHSAELPYQFPHFSNTTKLDGPNLLPNSQRLAQQMLGLWMSFVRDGRPVADGVPVWPQFHRPTDVLWLEPGKTQLANISHEHRCGFWQGLYPALLQ
jgi:para-nitrobenzyl esterase